MDAPVKALNTEKAKALQAALAQIEKQFGKGSIMRLGEGEKIEDIQVVSTGSLGLDIALGVGWPATRARGRDLRPRKLGQDHAHAASHRRDAEARRHLRLHRRRTRTRHPIRAEAGRQPARAADQPARHRRTGAGDRRRAGAQRQRSTSSSSTRWPRSRPRPNSKARWVIQPARPAGAADEPGAAQAHRHDQEDQHHGHLHQPDPHEDRRDVRQPRNHHRRQRAEVLRQRASRYPPHRQHQEGRRGHRLARPRSRS